MANKTKVWKENKLGRFIYSKLGGLLALSTIAAYAIDFKLFINPWVGMGFFVITVLAGAYSTYQSRKINDGASFKQAFTSYFITVALGYLIGSLTTIIVFLIIDPDAAKVLDEEHAHNDKRNA